MTPLLLALLLLGAPAASPAAGAAGVLQSLEREGRKLLSMRADFEQTKLFLALDETETMRGKVALQVPGRFRWDYTSPQPSAMLIKDGRFARYFPQTRQVVRGSSGKGEADLLVGFGPGSQGLGKKYDVSLVGQEQVGGRATHVLDLKPKAGQGGLFAEIRLWVDAVRFVPVQTRLTEPTRDHTTVRFDNVEINPKLSGDAFDLKLPKDVVEVR